MWEQASQHSMGMKSNTTAMKFNVLGLLLVA